VIESDKKRVEQFRDHAEIYMDIVSDIQSKYIALHVGIFWGIGVFIIKNGDTLKIQLDSDEMIQHLSTDEKSSDRLIEDKKRFIKMLAEQRDLKYLYCKIPHENNISSKLL
ncbi:MAG: hypothetical protein ACKO7N_00055, partial [Candidatus Nitrosotenuis sp.]